MRRAVLWGGVVAVLLAIVVLAGPNGSNPGASAGPGGTLALRRFLESSGVAIRDGAGPPGGGGTFVLLQDVRTRSELRPILSWVRSGGRLVLADPESFVVSMLHLSLARHAGDFSSSRTMTPGCAAPEVVGIRSVEVAASDGGLQSTSPRSVGCFAIGSGEFLVHRPVGRGLVVALGGWSFLTNEFLRQADDAVLARNVMGPGPVVFGPPVPPGHAAEGRGIWASLPLRAKVVLVLIALAVVAFGLVRGQRLGKPVLEESISPIPGTELVAASAALYRRTRASAFCGTLLRKETATRLSRRLGLPRDSSPDALARAVASTTGRSEEDVRRAFEGPEPRDDDELMALGRELEEIARSVETR